MDPGFYLESGLRLLKIGSMVSSGDVHDLSAFSSSSGVSLAPESSRLLASKDATVFLLSLSPIPKFFPPLLAFFFSEEEELATAAAAAKSLEVSAAAAPALSLFIRRAACMAEKLEESRRLSKAAANCC